ncbi:FtsX-like permease family protein [Heliobacterium gestii]|uniref:FtsX-like permease family protein n=1 Tax=Heliomicrobium gestii TaxID=2699 RepID=A0A845LES1_HELGE|nr:ABC transporter permease [Heliomicrobium gestii]MBM7867668.1 putative ABC transport system permease protein [Heliomicrobium gestii]MZP44061.1 FtsX-like permease family protein [Heliomicrobium gestii]
MNLLELFKVALQGIRVNKLRSGLTILGLVIGIAAVVTVITVSEAGQSYLKQQIQKFGSTSFTIYPNWNDETTDIDIDDITMEDVTALKELIPELSHVSPMNQFQTIIEGKKAKKRASVYGVNESYFSIQRNLKLVQGRSLNASDASGTRAVAVVSKELAKELFGHTDVVGLPVKLEASTVTIIGVYQQDKFALDQSRDLTAYVPITFAQFAFDRSRIFSIEAATRDEGDVTAATEKAKSLLNRRHHTKDHYRVNSIQETMGDMNKVTGVIAGILSGVAAISLLVGGIGVMNIMLVSVTERTREIGLRKALGAERRHILIQFLMEGVVLCLFGGSLGALVGIGGSWALAHFVGVDAPFSWTGLLVAFTVSSLIGIFFSLYPANRAAKLDPIEALRYE